VDIQQVEIATILLAQSRMSHTKLTLHMLKSVVQIQRVKDFLRKHFVNFAEKTTKNFYELL
jgi:hypothetical protein